MQCATVENKVFQALADPTRRRIVEALLEGERAVNDLVESVEIHQSGVSRHLRILSEAGFVDVRPVGAQRFYSLRAEPFRELDTWVHQYRKLWEARLDRFATALERRWAAVVVVVAVLGVAAGSVAVAVRVVTRDVDVPTWVGVGMLAGVAGTVACVAVGLAAGRGDRRTGAVWVRRGVLVSLLLTQLLVFRAVQWVGVAGLAVDLLVLAALGAALGRDDERRQALAAHPAGRRGAL